MLAYFSGLVFNRAAPARLVIRIAQVKCFVMIVLQFINCAFYGEEDNFGLDANLLMHESILMYQPPAVDTDIDEIGLLNNVHGRKFDAVTSKLAFERLQDLHCPSMSLYSSDAWLSYLYVDKTVLTGFTYPRIDSI